MKKKQIELLAPAKNKDFGIQALIHGADAVYIGAPQFGARNGAGNPISDIEELIRVAHVYKAKVYVTLNTLLYDNEIDEAVSLIRQLYNIGTDALIIQDMGLLETDLPPIPLHASTQTHNYTPEKVLFLEKIGFQRVILARELSINGMAEIKKATTVELEAFIHGSLCVSYSGQCYMSHAINQRSGNRGNCSQPCRSAYSLMNEQGEILAKDTHLLSLKDLNASSSLETLIEAGITSLKIEGRLKDLSYIKNITSFYRQKLDTFFEGKPYTKTSSGNTSLFFSPDPEKTFNRGYTEYLLHERKEKTGTMYTQKSIGKPIGIVDTVGDGFIEIDTHVKIVNGDGLCFFSKQNMLDGFLVNQIQGKKIYPNKEVILEPGTQIFRNNDFQFEKQLQGVAAQRKIAIWASLRKTNNGFTLEVVDEEGISVSEHITMEFIPAIHPDKAKENIIKQLSKTGDTPFDLKQLTFDWEGMCFFQVSVLNDLRRKVLNALMFKRRDTFIPPQIELQKNNYPYPEKELDFHANILNEKAQAFYKRHGVESPEWGFEKQDKTSGKTVMVCKHCIKYQLEECPVYYKSSAPYMQNLYIENNRNRYRLYFNCKACEMHIQKM